MNYWWSTINCSVLVILRLLCLDTVQWNVFDGVTLSPLADMWPDFREEEV